MMKKAVPLALVLGSSTVLAVDNLIFGQTWSAGAAPTITGTGTASQCCFYTGNVIIGSTGSAAGTASGAKANSGDACYGFADGANTNTNTRFTATTTLTLPFTTPSATVGPTTTGAAPTTVNGKDASVQASADGLTLTLTLSPTTAGATCIQTLTRTVTAPTGLTGTTTWSVGDGVLTNSRTATDCCFLSTANNLVVTVTNGVAKTSGATTGTNAACTSHIGQSAAYTQTLQAGTSPVTAQTILDANNDLFTYDSTKGTLTMVSRGLSGCTQTLTQVSSGASIASVMTPVVVGVAALGLFA